MSDWRDRAACRDEDPELFFPIGTGAAAALQAEEAIRVCRRCPVRETCLEVALDNGNDGVWGGMTEEQRRALRRRRSRQAAAESRRTA